MVYVIVFVCLNVVFCYICAAFVKLWMSWDARKISERSENKVLFCLIVLRGG